MTKVNKVDFKNDMIFVHQEKTLFAGEREIEDEDYAVKEIRTHVFRTNEGVSGTKAASKWSCNALTNFANSRTSSYDDSRNHLPHAHFHLHSHISPAIQVLCFDI
jgi:hypothetical protein